MKCYQVSVPTFRIDYDTSDMSLGYLSSELVESEFVRCN
ncbi:C-C chemokine receptor type 5 [Gossypium arboreum]|uniref:C-C chemokine receptor type 5 n=1 Tax=Gossypium arboreum TaxID=29729 RepID=A0A0B0MLS4_GOSAR|nr:C-C chemokine receptor type 5 [Gossypium arboreum]